MSARFLVSANTAVLVIIKLPSTKAVLPMRMDLAMAFKRGVFVMRALLNYLGGKRMAPSRRITSPLSMSLSRMCITNLA